MNGPIGRVWRWPVALAVFSSTALVSALVSDGWGDVWSWIGLGMPVVVGSWFAWPRRPSRDSRK